MFYIDCNVTGHTGGYWSEPISDAVQAPDHGGADITDDRTDHHYGRRYLCVLLQIPPGLYPSGSDFGPRGPGHTICRNYSYSDLNGI